MDYQAQDYELLLEIRKRLDTAQQIFSTNSFFLVVYMKCIFRIKFNSLLSLKTVLQVEIITTLVRFRIDFGKTLCLYERITRVHDVTDLKEYFANTRPYRAFILAIIRLDYFE